MNVKPGASSNGRFDPHPLLVGGHRQTVLAHLVRRHLRWRHAAEDMVVRTGDDARLLLRVTWQPGPREERLALVLVHGLGHGDGGELHAAELFALAFPGSVGIDMAPPAGRVARPFGWRAEIGGGRCRSWSRPFGQILDRNGPIWPVRAVRQLTIS